MAFHGSQEDLLHFGKVHAHDTSLLWALLI
jgi:hypothetical protein